MSDRINAGPWSWRSKRGRPWLQVRRISLDFTQFGSVVLTLSTAMADAMAQAYVAPYTRKDHHAFAEERPARQAGKRFLPRDAR